MSDNTFDFDSLAPGDFAFSYKGANYVLREPVADGILSWQAAVMRSLIVMPNGDRVPGDRTNETRLQLLASCVYTEEEAQKDDKAKGVPVQVLKTWPNRVVDSLFDRAKRMAGEHEDVDTLDNLKKRRATLDERIAALEKAGEEAEKKAGPKS